MLRGIHVNNIAKKLPSNVQKITVSNDGSVSQIITNRTKIISILYNTEDLRQENSLYITQLST